MAEWRGHQVFLTASFAVVIAAVGIAQALIENSRDEPIQVLDLFREVPTVANLRSFESDLETQSWFARTLRPQMQYLRYLALADTGDKVIVGRDGWWFYRPGVRYLIEPCPTNSKTHTGPGEVVSAIVGFRDQLAERGIHLLVVPVPGKASVYRHMLSVRAIHRHEAVQTHTHRVMADLVAAGVEVVDLLDAYRRADQQASDADAQPFYLKRDTHWTLRGLRVAAEAVAQRIRDLGWAPPPQVAYDTRAVRVQRLGDILKMLETPPVESLFEPETVTCEQVIHPDTAATYEDDPDSPILVLGDSFLRIYESDEPGAAGFTAHLARELSRPLASIISDGGASTLVRQELARKPSLLAGKSLIVWEFVERDIRFGLEGWQDVPINQRTNRSSDDR